MIPVSAILNAKKSSIDEKELELSVRQRKALSYLYQKNPKHYALIGFNNARGDEIFAGVYFPKTILNFIRRVFGFARKYTLLFTYIIPCSLDSWALKEMVALGLTDADLDRSGNFITHNNPNGNLFKRRLEEFGTGWFYEE